MEAKECQLVVTANQGNSLTQLSELTIYGADDKPISPGKILGSTPSSCRSPGREKAPKGLDGSTRTKFLCRTLPAVLDAKFAETTFVSAYEVKSANDVPSRDPRDWRFECKGADEKWVKLDTQSGMGQNVGRFSTLGKFPLGPAPAAASPVVEKPKPECRVELFQHGGFGGWKREFGPGSYDCCSAFPNDDASSIRVIGSENCRATLFQHGSYKGWERTFSPGDYDCCGSFPNDDASSLKVYFV